MATDGEGHGIGRNKASQVPSVLLVQSLCHVRLFADPTDCSTDRLPSDFNQAEPGAGLGLGPEVRDGTRKGGAGPALALGGMASGVGTGAGPRSRSAESAGEGGANRPAPSF